MKINKLVLLSLMLATSFTACKKYEDGPTVSFVSRKERIANNWKVDRAYNKGNDVTSSYDAYDAEFQKNGAAKLNANYKLFGAVFSYDTKGTWTFEDKDEKLRLDFDENKADRTYTILKLKEKELWLKEAGGDEELHLKPR